jgi:sulfide:quinone oxidoreductase
MKNHHQVLIIGAGTAGITVAAQLINKNKNLDIAIIDPSEYHYYQPAWTLVGAGAFDFEKTKRKQADYIPKGVKWIKDSVVKLNPENNSLSTEQLGNITYDFLVVAPGLVMAPELLEGLPEALKADNVCSNYIDPNKTWKLINNFKGGNAVFTQPTTPIKCGGAPQKIMYLAEEYFRKTSKVRNETNVIFATPGSVIFGVKEFANTLNKIIYDRDIILKTFYSPTRIDSKNNKIYFHYSKPGENACIVTEDNKIQEEIHGESEIAVPYDILHIAPPQKAPDFVCKSKLAHQEGPNKGWLNVDINTLQNKDFPNVFSLGDVAALPTAKTGAAVRKQAPVVVDNILKLIANNSLGEKVYEGYSSCPLVTGFSKMVLAEFKYNNVRDSDPLISTFVDTTKEQYSMWLLKKYGLPYMYWNLMLKGKA